nr:fibrobacter succinogenes major paralogous domain-containing protein [Elizabethkingia ursingii]
MLSSLFYISSCRSADIDQDKVLNGSERSGGLAAVNINLLGSEYANSDKPAQVASINQKGLNVDNDIQHYSVLVSPSSFITAELTPNRFLSSVASSKNLNTIAAVTGDQLGAGNKFRVIVYKHDDGSYKTYQDYTIGQPVAPLMLDGGVDYDIVAYSYGVNTLPAISSGEQSNINSATVNYDDINRDFMYKKISYTPAPAGSSNILDIKLRHKLTQITTIINSGSLGHITNASGILTPHYRNGIVSLSSGAMSGRSTLSSGAVLSFPRLNTSTITSTPVFVNADTGGNATGGFSADITIAGATKTISFPNSFKITPENKSTLTINLKACGAYLGPDYTDWKNFMCQNLGATEGINPFSIEAGNYGAKYQWGAYTGEPGRYINQAQDQSNSETISGWLTFSTDHRSWSDKSKGPNDPCPSGYRVPTKDEWYNFSIHNTNNIERQGSWNDENNNYSSVVFYKNKSNQRTLMLPAAGIRDRKTGELKSRGSYGVYWSSSRDSNDDDGYHISIHSDSNGGVYYSVEAVGASSTAGYSVRCIEH